MLNFLVSAVETMIIVLLCAASNTLLLNHLKLIKIIIFMFFTILCDFEPVMIAEEEK